MKNFSRSFATVLALMIGLASGVVIFCACEFFVAQAGLMGYKILSQMFSSYASFMVAFFFGSMIVFEAADPFFQSLCQAAFPGIYPKKDDEGG